MDNNTRRSGDIISIQMMESFQIKVNGYSVKPALMRSRKSLALLQYLMLSGGQSVPNQRLLAALWPDEHNTNPENALKTLISRLRTMLGQISEGMGRCIVANHGGYQWVSQPNVRVDVLRIEEVFSELERAKGHPEICKPLYAELLWLYAGDFMQNEDVEQDEWIISRVASIHMRFTNAVYEYVDLLRQEEDYEQICVVCRKALEVNSFDDRLHMEIIDALMKTNRQHEAVNQYRSAEQMRYRYLGVPVSEELQTFYKRHITASQSLEFSLESIEREMAINEASQGAYVCEYMVFKDICNLQVRNLERMGATVNLAVIQLADQSGKPQTVLEQDNLMQGLIDVLRHNLRKGDLITRYAANTVALLLPMQDPEMGKLVLERIRYEFYRKFSNSSISFLYRLGRVTSGDMAARAAQAGRLRMD